MVSSPNQKESYLLHPGTKILLICSKYIDYIVFFLEAFGHAKTIKHQPKMHSLELFWSTIGFQKRFAFEPKKGHPKRRGSFDRLPSTIVEGKESCFKAAFHFRNFKIANSIVHPAVVALQCHVHDEIKATFLR